MAGAGNDTMGGSARSDKLWGGTGNDTLFGYEGADQLYGEQGNDKLFGGTGDDLILGGDGHDVLVGGSPTNWDQTLPAGVTDNDLLYGGAGDDALLGLAGDDTLYGETGNDELIGGEGNDRLYGGADKDRLFGGAGNDTLYGGDGDDVLVGGAASNETALPAGTADNNFLYGGAGNDTLIGGIGNDYIDGGQGADWMEGGKGDDTYIVNSVNDTILEQNNEGYDTVISSSNYLLNFGIEELRLTEQLSGEATIHATGNSLNNKLVGNNQNNIIDGVTGADVMIGKGGDDTYYVDNVGDQVIELSGEGTDRVQSSISYTLGANVENLVLLDFSKPEKGIIKNAQGVDEAIQVFGYPKANELDYMQGNAPQGYKGTCALTSISNLMTQAKKPTSEEQVVQVAINNHWAVTARPYGYCLAGHDVSEAANDVAWRTAA